MKLFSAASMTGTLFCALLVTAPSVSAEPPHKSNHRYAAVHANKVVVARAALIRMITTVSAFSLSRLPTGYLRFLHNDETFYYSDGVYYKKILTVT